MSEERKAVKMTYYLRGREQPIEFYAYADDTVTQDNGVCILTDVHGTTWNIRNDDIHAFSRDEPKKVVYLPEPRWTGEDDA